jgi:hypothetical protein
MRADIHFWWHLVSAASRATLIDLGSKRPFWLFSIEVSCAVAALRAYRAPESKRWAAIRDQWISEIRDVFIVIFSIGVAVFGYELVWNQPNQARLRQIENSPSNPSFLFNRTSVFPRHDSGPICVQVLLPQDFPGGSYKLPFKPVAPSPPTLYDNGSARRRGIDYTVSDNTIMVNFRPESKDSLSVWYTTDDSFLRILP